jgi:hypothetical protein
MFWKEPKILCETLIAPRHPYELDPPLGRSGKKELLDRYTLPHASMRGAGRSGGGHDLRQNRACLGRPRSGAHRADADGRFVVPADAVRGSPLELDC